jgi:Zn-dependent protease with chaperone function
MADMSQEEFVALIQKLEPQAKFNPAGYRQKLAWWARLGYGFIFFILAISLGLLALVIYGMVAGHVRGGMIRIVLFLGIFICILLRSLWITFAKPEGIPLNRAQSPELFAMVDELTTRIGAPRFDKVLLDKDFNAAVMQRPRLGIFGWPESYLLLGLPLLQSLSPEQFRAVIAHELGHLRGGDARFSNYIYRVNLTWQQVAAQLKDSGITGIIMGAFFQWYAPRFAAWSFVLNRQNEYDADRTAAQACGARVIADALCSLPIQGDVAENKYWEGVKKQMQSVPEAPRAAFSNLLYQLKSQEIPREAQDKTLQNALNEETGYADTHPSLTDRLKSLAVDARIPEPVGETAGERYLGVQNVAQFAQIFDKQWYETVQPQWATGYQQIQNQQHQLGILEEKVQHAQPLTSRERLQRADWTEDFRSVDAALPLFYELVSDPEVGPEIQIEAQFAMGRILLEKEDPNAVTYLQNVAQSPHQLRVPALAILQSHHQKQGNKEQAKALESELYQAVDQYHAQAESDSTISPNDNLVSHGLAREAFQPIRLCLSNVDEVEVAYLVQKPRPYASRPLYILVVIQKKKFLRLDNDSHVYAFQEKIIKALEVRSSEMPGEIMTFVVVDATKWLQKKVENIENTEIYRP